MSLLLGQRTRRDQSSTPRRPRLCALPSSSPWRGNHLLGQLRPTRSHSRHGRLPRLRRVEHVESISPRQGCRVLQIPTRTEGAPSPHEDCASRSLVSIEANKGSVEGFRTFRVHGISCFRPYMDDCPDGSAAFYPDSHLEHLSIFTSQRKFRNPPPYRGRLLR